MLPAHHDPQVPTPVLKRLLRRPSVQAVLAAVLGSYLDFALRTTRWTIVGEANLAPYQAGSPAVVAFWHECLPLMPALWNRARAATSGIRLHVLVSRHSDGRFIGDVIARFGLDVAHGSTARNGRERGGARGALTLLGALESGHLVVITPDGPRGPRRIAAPGVAQLAGLSGRPVLPCAAQTSRKKTLRSWDRMILPLPWGRGVIVCEAPIPVPRDGWETALPNISAALDRAAVTAEAWRPETWRP